MTPSILIIEDDLTFATMLKTWLGKKGFEVDTAGSSSRAKKQLSARSYDLILSDLRLPDQDGIHLLAWLRSQSCTTPFYYYDELCRNTDCRTGHKTRSKRLYSETSSA